MDNRPIVLDVRDIKKKYLIRHNFEKPDSFSGKLKYACDRITHPTKKYNTEDFYALNGVTFQIKQGEKVGIIGKNGAGKSTLLKVISRITEPSDGRIEFLGKVSAMLEVGTGFNAELTGRENVYLNGAILGMSKEEIDAKFDEIIEFSEIGKFIDTPVKRYSSGMFVRLAFAVASNLDPDILLVDEVLSVGDTRFQRKCIEKMKNISNSGKTIICVSHQMQTIRQLCDRVIVLKEGKVIYDGDVEGGIRIYNSEAYLEKFQHYEFNETQRPKGYTRETGEIVSLDIIGNDNSIYEVDSSIDFRLKVELKKPFIGDLSSRILIWTGNETPVEVGFTDTFANVQDSGTYEFDYSIKNHNLAPGLYKAAIILSGGASKSNSENIDYIYPAFVFEILNADGTGRMWPKEWGYKSFHEIEVKPVGKDK